jgi:hypothetical protein
VTRAPFILKDSDSSARGSYEPVRNHHHRPHPNPGAYNLRHSPDRCCILQRRASNLHQHNVRWRITRLLLDATLLHIVAPLSFAISKQQNHQPISSGGGSCYRGEVVSLFHHARSLLRRRNSYRCARADRCNSVRLLGSIFLQSSMVINCPVRWLIFAGHRLASVLSNNSTNRSISRRRPPMMCSPLSC